MSLLLGCIADDFTGGTDVAGMLVKNGMRTVQTIGVPKDGLPPGVDAVVIALKSRTSPTNLAIEESLAALEWLRQAGCRQFYFKYCSTFDSTAKGNIGPVAEAMMDALGVDFTIACPAFPLNRRTIYKGHLFVGDVLLSESGMRHHPLTPMTDANLVRVLQGQTRRKVGLVDDLTVRRGTEAIRTRFEHLRMTGYGFAIVDALTDSDLEAIGAACTDMAFVTAGSGVAIGLPANFRRRGELAEAVAADALPAASGLAAVVAGSCSVATNAQVQAMRAQQPSFRVDPHSLTNGHEAVVAGALQWAARHVPAGPVLIYASAGHEELAAVQAELGAERAGALVEDALARIARGLVDLGVDKLIVAGGETSGAVVKALGIKALRIGPEIDPGVPWTCAVDAQRPLLLALKSGNFGSEDFFLKAWKYLPRDGRALG